MPQAGSHDAARPGMPARRKRGASMGDVARLAQVSSQTVSRVSNGITNVAPETRQRVLAAMAELGYRPNSAARALKRGEFRTLGVITVTLSTVGNARTLEAISDSAAEQGYAVTLMPVAVPTRDQVQGAFTRLGELTVDAIVLMMEGHLLDVDVSLPRNVPVVVADADVGEQFMIVGSAHEHGARAAVEHLLGLGHRTVWHVAGPDDAYAAKAREAGWSAALREAGARVPPVLRGEWSADITGGWSAESGYRAGRLLAGEPHCTAVFAANDQMALGLYRALQERGLRVPQDVSVVGFDDIPEAAMYPPPLTTVRQDFDEIGRRCVAVALHQIAAQSPEAGRTSVDTVLVPRASTAPPRDR